MSYSSFDQLALGEPLQRALRSLGYQRPTPVQAAAIPPLLEGRDLLGCSQTGTGKTAAFALPILHRISSSNRRTALRQVRALVLTPTRELAVQIADSFKAYGRYLNLRSTVVFGGVSKGPQIKACSRGLDVLVATPGRLLDLISMGHIHLGNLEYLVLDEADRMLDMGFLPDIKRIMALMPKRRQNLLFSATMPLAIAKLADSILADPVKVQVARAAAPLGSIKQQVLFVAQSNKRALLGEVLQDSQTERVLVFTRTKHAADRVARQLVGIQVRAEAIHGNKSQRARQAALANFRNGRTRVLVATDVASRGIDVQGITHVINYDLPHEPETYVHRIGRTGRNGSLGVAISFCNAQEKAYLRHIERLTRQTLSVRGHLSDGQGQGRPPGGRDSQRPPRRRRKQRAAA